MKKLLLSLLILSVSAVWAINEPEQPYEQPIILENVQEEDENIKPVILEPDDISPYTKEALRGIIEKDYDLKSPDGMFHNQLQKNFVNGPLSQIGTQFSYQGNFSETFSNESNFKYTPALVNVGIKGKFKSKKEGFNTLFDLTPMHQNFFHRAVLDAWIETNRIKNHTLMFGTSRPTVGIEGGQSPYTLPFINRTQTARNFANVRKTGIRLKGNYKYADYDIGGYSSDTWYSEFMPGVETDLWLNLKPLAASNGKYGNLNLGGGITTGERNSHDFFVTSAAVAYDYKKFWMRAEYQNADGSNGASGITEKKRWGYNITLAYHITKKLEALLRFDDFDPDKDKTNNNTREYTAGVNYYLLGQTARLILNYIFCENQNKSDSHKLIFGTQFLL